MEVVDPVAAYQQRAGEIAERAERARAQVAEIRPAVSSDDGAVTLAVTATGSLVSIEFGPAAGDLKLSELAAEIMRTAQLARVRAAEQTQQVLAGLVGESSAAMEFVRRQLPALDEAHAENSQVADDGYRGRGF